MKLITQISYNGTPIAISETGSFLGITYWAAHHPHTTKKFTIYQYLGKVINDYNVYAFSERRGRGVIFRKFEDLNTDIFKPFLLNMDIIEREMEQYK